MKEQGREMANVEVSVVERPTVRRRVAGDPMSFPVLLRSTLESGRAVSVPVKENETRAVARNRIAATGYNVAKRLGVSLRTGTSDDGKSILLWLEPKPAK